MRLTHLRQRLHDLGAAPCHEGRVLRAWVQRRSLDIRRRRAEDFLPLAVRNDGVRSCIKVLHCKTRRQNHGHAKTRCRIFWLGIGAINHLR